MGKKCPFNGGSLGSIFPPLRLCEWVLFKEFRILFPRVGLFLDRDSCPLDLSQKSSKVQYQYSSPNDNWRPLIDVYWSTIGGRSIACPLRPIRRDGRYSHKKNQRRPECSP